MKKHPDQFSELLSKNFNVRADIVPVIDEDDEDILLNDDNIEDVMPILPVIGQVLFPGVLLPIAAQRPKARHLLSIVREKGGHIAVFTQRNDNDDPTLDDLYPVGVIARVLKVFDIRQDTTVVILQGVYRCTNLLLSQVEPFFTGSVQLFPEISTGLRTQAMKKKIRTLRSKYSEIMRSRMQDEELAPMLSNIGSDKIFINFAASHLDIDTEQKYNLLACDHYRDRISQMFELLETIKNFDLIRHEIDDKTKDLLDRQQREYYLRNQLNVIQEELGESEPSNPWGNNELDELKQRAEQMNWPQQVAEAFDKEMARMKHIQPMSSDYTVQLTYLETLLDLPWNHCVPENFDISAAHKELDRDHFGIEKVKQRIIEYLAVMKRQQEKGLRSKAQVLCLVGPPGTGKTSICRSIAKALDRPYQRIALGGLHDEAEIRGHRRTYVGAMPGRILQEIIKAKASNPLFVLDEIDKVQTNSFHGDPSSALLELLDPEQNCHFHDNFVNIDYDLSQVFFIATANSTSDIQPALLDRMEVIEFSGYVEEEKVQIAKRHLLPRIMHDNVVDRRSLKFSDPILQHIIQHYTREGGVRQLEKQLSKIVRHRVVAQEVGEKTTAQVTSSEISQVLGLPIHNSENSRQFAREGVVTGLAWTPVGGEILFIEASLSKGKGTLSMTGNLGDVMKESATLAFEYIKSNSANFQIPSTLIEESNIHIHVPEGATPKDGPSAGITMFVAMLSSLLHRKVNPKVAMTGEITLRGDVTPVGGIKEKILAAKRAGITDIILCDDNRRDIEDIDSTYLTGLSFHYINDMSQALPLAFIS